MARECPECKGMGLIPLSSTAWGCCLCGYNSDDNNKLNLHGLKEK